MKRKLLKEPNSIIRLVDNDPCAKDSAEIIDELTKCKGNVHEIAIVFKDKNDKINTRISKGMSRINRIGYLLDLAHDAMHSK